MWWSVWDVISLVILFPIKWPVTSAVFWITPFEVVLSASLPNCLARSESFGMYLQLEYLPIFLQIF